MTEQIWDKKHVYKVKEMQEPSVVDDPDHKALRKEIEPWLTALFQSEYLSLLVGSGISTAVHYLATGKAGAGMGQMNLTQYSEQISAAANEASKKAGRGTPNIEDQIRVTNELIRGLEIFCKRDTETKLPPAPPELKSNIKALKKEFETGLKNFSKEVLNAERNIVENSTSHKALEYLMSFLVSFASRTATRERLNIFSINYDRILELGAELTGIRLIDRFVGSINPIFRSSRLQVDMHYNPPGIRGEPRYLEGVAYFTKLHGSLDWVYHNDVVKKISLPIGAQTVESYLPVGSSENALSDLLMIYPNSSKDRETSEYPYVELFRDLASAVCKPNSTLVVYGYSFGDEHINRMIEDMLTIPSTHLVIIAYSDEGNRIKNFYEKVKKQAQISLLIGNHFADLEKLVNHYLPKPAIDRATSRMTDILKSRGIIENKPKDEEEANLKPTKMPIAEQPTVSFIDHINEDTPF